MAPSSRVLMLAQMGFVLQDWDELQALGETATQRRASADTLAVKIARWKAEEIFVSQYSGVARAFGALDFSCTEHDEWCWLVTSQVDQGTSNGILTRPQKNDFTAKYARLLGGHPAAEDWLQWMAHQVSRRRELLETCSANDTTLAE